MASVMFDKPFQNLDELNNKNAFGFNTNESVRYDDIMAKQYALQFGVEALNDPKINNQEEEAKFNEVI
jgi:hypothetical protein